MKKEELIALGISPEIADQILALHGKGIEKVKEKVATAEQQRDGYKEQLDAASAEIKGYKDMDIETIKKNATDWEAKAVKAQADADEKIAKVLYDQDLDNSLNSAKVKDIVSVKAHLKTNLLKHDPKERKVIGLDEQLAELRKTHDHLFSDPKEIKITTKIDNSKSTTDDPMIAAARKAAKLPDPVAGTNP